MSRVRESAVVSDFDKAFIRLQEHELRMRTSYFDEILLRRETGFLLEKPGEMRRRESDDRGHLFDRKRTGVIDVDVLDDAVDIDSARKGMRVHLNAVEVPQKRVNQPHFERFEQRLEPFFFFCDFDHKVPHCGAERI